MTFKQQVYEHCYQLINERVAIKQQILADLRNSAANETKSTAGDKHETALAMLQIEQANNGRQLDELLFQKNALVKINPLQTSPTIVAGSLVKTNNGYLFISVALGKIMVNDTAVIALSPQSPLGSKLLGLRVNNVVEMNGKTYKIERIE